MPDLRSFERFFSKSALIALIFCLIILARFFAYINSNGNETIASGLTVENILAGINNERTLRNLSSLKTDFRLSQAAQEKSSDMQQRHYFSHTDPEGNYIWPKIVAAGYTPYITLGENLAIEFYNTESLVAAWMNSPTHRANIVNENFNDQGMGLALGNPSTDEYYSAITNTFGALLAVKPKPSTPPEAKPTPTPVSLKVSAIPTPTPTKAPTQNNISEAPTKSAQANPTPTPTSEKATQKPAGVNPRLSENSLASEIIPNTNNTSSKAGPVGFKENQFQKNRKINIIFAVILIALLVIDLKLFQKLKYPGLDKKLNNLSLLFLAILLTAFLYWL